MKKEYVKPIARLINYQYEEQVKADSNTCSGESFVATGNTCGLYRVGVVTRSADPCWFESSWKPA